MGTGFDYKAFEAAEVVFPTEKIPVPELKKFFPEGAQTVWEIKSLTGVELAYVNEAKAAYDRSKLLIDALAKGDQQIAKKALKVFTSSDGSTLPEDHIRRLKMLQYGTVPECPEHICVKIAYSKPNTFYAITNRIIALTGDGADLGK